MRTFPSLGGYNGQFVHPLLAVGGCPHPQDVPAFVAAGIRGIIDARSVFLKEHVIYIASLPDSIYWELLGTWDGCYALSPAHRQDRGFARTTVDPVYAEFMVEETARVVRDHRPVLIHCGGGIGRSGNLAAVVYAALEDVTVDEALRRMRLYRPVLADWGTQRWGCDGAHLVEIAREILNAHPPGA